ncbi:MAG: PQQ-like beta-propeller repeat protein [Planctomycetes bacterium]|nr:PQQ-like beta-propeller repeat protein [Planctomycetota bacterium]
MNTQTRPILSMAFFLTLASSACADDWPQWLGPKRDSVWRETGILEKFPEGGPKVLWRKPVNVGYSGPAVNDGRVFVMDFVPKEPLPKNNPGKRAKAPGIERVLCLDANNGELLWKHETELTYEISYPGGPRATPTVDSGKVYTFGAEGHLTCLDAAKGTLLWSKNLPEEYKTKTAIWGYASHPLVVDDKLICVAGGDGSVAVAFDKNTGKEIWKALSAKQQGYCPPTLIEAGGTRQLLIWHAESINSLNPHTGELYWSVPLASAGGMSIATPRQLGNYLFVTGITVKAVLLKLSSDKPGAEVVWRGTPKMAVYPVNMTPFLENGHIYAVDSTGEFRCVAMEKGERIWDSFAPSTGSGKANSATAFVVKNGDRFFIASETGDLIIAKLSPQKYEEISRWKMLEPASEAFGRKVVWSHPAFANRCVYARNDREIVCVSLAK